MAISKRALDVLGYGDRAVPNALWRSRDDSGHLAVVLPGWAYSSQAPLLHYLRIVGLELGADVLTVDYGYDRLHGFTELSESDQDLWFQREVTAAVDAVRPYERYTLIGKSIGTQAVGYLLEEVPMMAEAEAVLLTPTFSEPGLAERLPRLEQRCLTVIGTRDPDYEPGNLALARRLGELLVIDDADHALEVPGSVDASLVALSTVTSRVRGFLVNQS